MRRILVGRWNKPPLQVGNPHKTEKEPDMPLSRPQGNFSPSVSRWLGDLMGMLNKHERKLERAQIVFDKAQRTKLLGPDANLEDHRAKINEILNIMSRDR